jgi:hypothetical protein
MWVYKRIWDWRLIIGLVAVAIVLAAGGYWYFTRGDSNPIPPEIRKQLTFSPFVLPVGTKDFSTADYKLTTAESGIKVLSYGIHTNTGAAVTLSEYTQPDQFTDIAEYKDRFLTNVAKQYATVQTSNGVIYLGRLTRDNNRQLGIMLEKGLLVFMNPDKEMDQVQWHSLGDQLVIQKITN